MVGFLIATHGGFAKGILDSIELIAGKQEKIDTLAIMHETSIDEFGKELTQKIINLDDGEGVIVFTDLLMASPYNQATISYRTLQGLHEYRVLYIAHKGAAIFNCDTICTGYLFFFIS